MKVVADSMIWVSYSVSHDGFRHKLIEAARRKRVRFFVSDYILTEVAATLIEDFDRTPRYAEIACQHICRFATTVALKITRKGWVPGDPDDDPIIHTSLVAKADYLVTADQEIRKLGQIQDLRIIGESDFAELLALSIET